MDIKIFDKFQPSTKRGLVKSCQICNKEFGFLKETQHQCKRCFRAICENCGKTKRDVYKLGMTKNPHRLCTVCGKQSDFIRSYIANNNLKFGEDSPIVKKWLKKIPEITVQDEHRQTNFQKPKTKLTLEIFNEMWDAYNFSMREFIGILTFEKSQKDVFKLVNEVYEELQEAGFDEKLENILPVIIFMLCFGTTASSSKIIQRLLRLRDLIADEKSLLKVYLKALGVEESDMKKLSEYLAPKMKQFISSFSINTVTIQCSIHLFSRILQRIKIQQIYMLFAIIIQDNLKYLLKNKNNKIQCDIEIVRNCKLETYGEKYRYFSNIKIAQFFKNNEEKKDGDFGNREDDNSSFKTKSFKDDDQLPEDKSSSRKTQKPVINPNLLSQLGQKSFSYRNQHDQCFECEKKNKRIEQLLNKLKLKDKEIEDLTFKINFKRKDSVDDFRLREKSIPMLKQIQEEDDERREKTVDRTIKMERTNSMLQELQKIERENFSLKSQIKQLEMSNKMLKNKIQSTEMLAQTRIRGSDLGVEGENKIIEMLQKKLEEKNKLLEEQYKKNKLLSYQIDLKANDKVSAISEAQYLKKIQNLTDQLGEEQAEKIALSEELFQLKEIIKEKRGSGGMTNQKGQKNCRTF